jgi:hypothetical protein
MMGLDLKFGPRNKLIKETLGDHDKCSTLSVRGILLNANILVL